MRMEIAADVTRLLHIGSCRQTRDAARAAAHFWSPVGFFKGLVGWVVWLKEERNADDCELHWALGVDWIGSHIGHRPLQQEAALSKQRGSLMRSFHQHVYTVSAMSDSVEEESRRFDWRLIGEGGMRARLEGLGGWGGSETWRWRLPM